MNKTGFTLIELLAVITVLAIISIITVPVIIKTINNSKDSTYNSQVKMIERASENWYIKNGNDISVDNRIIVDLDYLISEGYLKGTEIISTKTGEVLEGCVVITFSSNQYNYQFSENDCECIDNTCTKYEKNTSN